jgi:hypothetical protein
LRIVRMFLCIFQHQQLKRKSKFHKKHRIKTKSYMKKNYAHLDSARMKRVRIRTRMTHSDDIWM